MRGVHATLPADIAVFAAAVADWRVAEPKNAKLKKLLAETLSETTTRKVTLTIEILTEKRKPQVQITLTKDV